MKKKKKTVLLTGSEGELGRRIVKKLLKRGYRVIGVDTAKPGEHKSGFQLLHVDLRRTRPIYDIYTEVDYVVACAADGSEDDYERFSSNLRILMNTLDTVVNLHNKGRLLRLVVADIGYNEMARLCTEAKEQYGFEYSYVTKPTHTKIVNLMEKKTEASLNA
jgi:nucleoside-diphosphate-sugar epimerase